MRIEEFVNFIREIPYKNHAFDIYKEKWKIESQQEYINQIFIKEIITLNRFNLFNSTDNIKELIFKTLMWGYPTKGRGKNIENILENKNLKKLIRILESYKHNEISISQLRKDIKEISGLGLSTMTKFTHFLKTTINGNRAIILDSQIIAAINTGRFEELNQLKGISYNNAIKKYDEYLFVINDLSNKINVEVDQIEMFLFIFGRTLSEIN
ncbi:MAG: hypothetical protein L3J20_08895 [Flavobacteriaceae bacterium]|nr:hypothetical protein [Flavobacteriaceae bacterium]